MLFSLDKQDVRRLRKSEFRPTFTDAQMLVAAYRTDPAVVARILPKPLKPAPEPRALAFVAHYPKTNFGCVYNEGALFVQAIHRGVLGGYCLSMPVDDDMAMVGGRENFGFPKKMAESITLEEDGSHIVGRVVRKGVEILRIELDASEPATAEDLSLFAPRNGDGPHNAVSYLSKFSMRADGKGFDFIPKLIRQTTELRPRPGQRKGTVRVVVKSSPTDPLGDVPVIGDPILGTYGHFDNVMLPGRTAARFWNPLKFLPHALFKTDLTPVLLGWTDEGQPQLHTPGDLGYRGTNARHGSSTDVPGAAAHGHHQPAGQ